MINRDKIIKEAIHNCYKEMYAKAQPSADYEQLIQDKKDGKIDESKDGPVYIRHYLSQEEYDYILDKYLDAYRLRKEWESNITVLENYLENGGFKDSYVDEEIDEDGHRHPGYRTAELVSPIKDQISDIMREFDCSEAAQEVGEDIYNKVMETIKNCKDFYQFDREEDKFRFTISLGHSPICNKEVVKKWWKEYKDIDLEIEERIPELFWYYDNGYTDEELAYEFENLGENWKEELYKQWKTGK